MKKTKQSKPYNQRTDIEKIKSNWNKTLGLFARGEWSGAILRAVTAAEIASNLVIREELQAKKHLDKEFVDKLLKWANGIQGKFQRLIVPACKGTERHDKFKLLQTSITEINKHRNAIAHRGQFKKESTSRKVIETAKDVIESFVGTYYPNM